MFDNQAWKRSMSISGREMNPTSSRNLLIILLICLFVLPIIIIGLTATAANADSSVDEYIFMPVTLNGYFEGSHQEGIAGRVLAYGAPLANTKLDLYQRKIGSDWKIVKSTTTNEAGYYFFGDASSLGPEEEYYVGFGPNESNPKHVYFWYGPIIATYKQGQSVPGGNFDIADVPLLAPASGTVDTLPINFRWEKRGLSGDSYRLVIIDFNEGVFWRSVNLGDVDSFTLNSLAPGMEFGKKYDWYVEVYMGPENFGESYMINEIIFLQATTQQKSISEDVFTLGSGRGGR